MKPNYRPWAERIIEVALKTLLELNTEFSIISVPHSEKIKGKQLKSIACEGFELIDERHVCAKIIQNSMSSFLFSGSWQCEFKPHVEEGIRFWNFYRELSYKNTTINGFCDIILDRTFYDGKTIKQLNQPVYIEAKRAKTKAVNDLSSGEVRVTKEYNYSNCMTDIKKLIIEKEYVLKNNIYENMFGHLLIWGDTNNPIKDNPKECCKYLNEELKRSEFKNHKLTIHQVRWFPLDRIDKLTLTANHRVKKWGWVTLIEVHKRKSAPNMNYV